MTVLEWFDAYDGPKSLSRDNGKWRCTIGWNERTVIGITTGYQIDHSHETLEVAVELARGEFITRGPGAAT